MRRFRVFGLALSIFLTMSPRPAAPQMRLTGQEPICDPNGILNAGKPLLFPPRNGVALGISLPKRSFLIGESIPAYLWIDNEGNKDYTVSTCDMFSDWDVAVWGESGQRLQSTAEQHAMANGIGSCDSNVSWTVVPHSCQRVAVRQLNHLFELSPGAYRLGELPWPPLMEATEHNTIPRPAPLPPNEQALLFNVSYPAPSRGSEASLSMKPKPFIDETIAIPQVWGRVVRSDTGSPIPGVVVEINNGSPNDACCHYAVTDSDGHYSFRALADGVYDASAFADGFVTGDYHCTVGPVSVCKDREQRITPSSHLTMNFDLIPEATIQGKVFTSEGHPAGAGLVVNAVPTALFREDSNGVYSNWGESVTDSQGRFEIRKLPPASYLIRVHENNGGRLPSPEPHYHEAWYRDSSSLQHGVPVSLKQGQALDDVRLIVHTEKRYNIVLWLSGPDGVPTPTEYGVTIRDSDTTAVKQSDGSYLIRNVSPGHYKLDVFASGVPLKMAWPHSIVVDVLNQDVTIHADITDPSSKKTP